MNRRLTRRTSTVIAALALVAAPVAGVHASSDEERDLEVPEPVESCLSCHAIAADEPELEGPTLWGVMGRRIGGAPDYVYSDALASQQGYWDRETLDRFLASPQQFAPGVNMTFGGVRSAADRKVVLDFLETLK
jgi:cytochrome c2